jgi:hypothetical protein
MNNFMFNQCMKAFDNIEHIRYSLGLNKFSFFFDFIFEISIFTELCDNEYVVFFIELRFYLDNMRLLLELPLDI